MVKTRILLFSLTVIVVGILATFAINYAKGYRFSLKTLQFTTNGLLVLNSEPTGAQIYVNGDLKTATDATIPLSPGIYDVSIKKEGLISWNKRLTIQKEIVTQADVTLFPIAASLSPITFSGATNPIASSDFTKIAYADSEGLWVSETFNLPIGFNREPKKLTDGDYTKNASWQFSPDSREIMLTATNGVYLLDTSKFTAQAQLVNISSTSKKTLTDWQDKKQKLYEAQLTKLPEELQYIFKTKITNATFSPDENKILYEASSSATIPVGLVKELPGSSTQEQKRDIKVGFKYVYDIKEDRNFEIAEPNQPAYWFPSSAHIILPTKDKIVISDYDATNKQTIYSGSYVAPIAYPYSNTTRLIILTNLGSNGNPPNLYSLSLK